MIALKKSIAIFILMMSLLFSCFEIEEKQIRNATFSKTIDIGEKQIRNSTCTKTSDYAYLDNIEKGSPCPDSLSKYLEADFHGEKWFN